MLGGGLVLSGKWKLLSRYVSLEKTEIPVFYSSSKTGSVPLLKTLFSNSCRLNCKYCPFRFGRNIERRSWSVDKLVEATIKLYDEGKIKGLFLSSSIFSDPDFVVEKELEVVEKLREKGFKGYIHVRLMPGVSKHYVIEAVRYADRVGLNLEAPGRSAFCEIAPDKGDFNVDILKRIEWVTRLVRRFKGKSVDTQLIYWRKLGSDLDYIKVSEDMYRMGVKRVYYSPFTPFKQTPLEREKPEEKVRAYRLYQVSFLLRDYGFSLNDIEQISDSDGNLPNGDPKESLALTLLDGSVDLKTANFKELVLIPGVGPSTAKKILDIREKGKLNLYNLRRILGRNKLKKVLRYATL